MFFGKGKFWPPMPNAMWKPPACRQEEEEGGRKTREAAGGLGAVREEARRPGSGRQTEIDSN